MLPLRKDTKTLSKFMLQFKFNYRKTCPIFLLQNVDKKILHRLKFHCHINSVSVIYLLLIKYVHIDINPVGIPYTF